MTMRRRAAVTIAFALALLQLLTVLAYANPLGHVGGFEIDGDFAFPHAPPIIGATKDWATVGGVTRVNDAPPGTENSFVGGSKENEPDGMSIDPDHGVPSKLDFQRVYAANEVTPTSAYLWLGFELITASGQGDTHVNFEINKKSTSVVNSQGTVIPERSDGDVLIVYDYAGGSGPVTIELRTWIGDPDNPGTPQNEEALFGQWSDAVSLPAGSAFASINFDAAVTRPAGAPFGGGTVAQEKFGEAGLDFLKIFGEGALSCPGFSTIWVKSRSSGESFNSELKDLVGPAAIDFSTCGDITVLKRDDSGAPLNGATFQAWKDDGDNVFEPNPGGDTLSGTCVSGEEGTAGRCTFESLSPGTYFVRETQAPLGYVLDPTVSTVVVGFRQSVTVEHVYVDPKIQYRLSITPATDTNLVDNDHVFTVHLEKSLDGGQTWVDAPGEDVSLALSGPGSITNITPAGPNATSCTTNASGLCFVTIHSNTPGLSTLTANFNKQTATTPIQLSKNALKQWVNYRISIGPEATNLVGTTHTFTVTLERTTNGTTWSPVSGATIDATKTAGPGSITGGTCTTGTTSAAGTCTVTITSNTPGNTTIQAAYGAVEGNTSATFSASAVKHWVDYRITVQPDATNLVGQPHTFTVTVERNAGNGWVAVSGASVNLAWSGVAGSRITSIPGGTVAPDGLSGTCTTGGGGTCTVIVNSSAAGTGTLTATFSTVLDSGQVTRNDSATKTWVSFRITVTPEEDTNLLPEEPTHTFTVTVSSSDDGQNWDPVVGGTVDLDLSGTVATLTSVGAGGSIAGDGSSGTCVTNASGQCTVVATTTGPGAVTLTASYKATVGEASVTINDSGDKTWITYRVTVTPESATNLVDSDHTFTVTVESTDDGNNWDPVVGVKPTIDWNGPGSVTGGTCISGVTDSNGKCTVIVHSGSTGVGTLTASYLATVGRASHTFTDSGDKTWIDYDILVTPLEAANLVGTNHVFTVTVFKDSGDGKGFQPLAGAHPTIGLAGPGTIVTNTCATTGTNAAGTCTVTVSSDTPGLTTLTATYLGSADNGSAEFVANATKQWVDYRINVNPPEATNPVGTTHTFTVSLDVDTGEGFVPAAGRTVDLTLTGPGTIISIPGGTIGGDGRSGTCVTDDNGECTVTITSNIPGTATLTASFDAVVGETSRTFSDFGLKHWVPTVKTFTLTVTGVDRAPAGVTYWARYESVPAGVSGAIPLACVEVAANTLSCTAQVDLPAGTYDMEVFYRDARGAEITIKTFDDEVIRGPRVDNIAGFEWPKVLPNVELPKTGNAMPGTAGIGAAFVALGSGLRYVARRRRSA